jgi:hypothetical protein
MSHIDTKIEEHKQMLADLEKQKKDEEEAYKNTIEWNMEQLDKYVDQKESIVISKMLEREISLRRANLNDTDEEYIKEMKRYASYIRSEHYKEQYFWPEGCYPHYPRYHIFEFVYRILKCLFMSTKQISNHYNEITSRLDKIENIMTKTFVDYNDMKERLDILEEENKHLKEKLYDLIT